MVSVIVPAPLTKTPHDALFKSVFRRATLHGYTRRGISCGARSPATSVTCRAPIPRDDRGPLHKRARRRAARAPRLVRPTWSSIVILNASALSFAMSASTWRARFPSMRSSKDSSSARSRPLTRRQPVRPKPLRRLAPTVFERKQRLIADIPCCATEVKPAVDDQHAY